MNYIYFCYFVLSVLAAYGLVWLTRFAFNAKYAVTSLPEIGLEGSVACVVDIDGSKLRFAKVAAVILWIQMGLLGVYTLYLMFSRRKC